MFVTNWISTTKIQKISEITNFFRHYFLSRTEVYIKRICLFAYGEKVAILPKNLRKIVVFKEKVVYLQRKSGNIAKKSS